LAQPLRTIFPRLTHFGFGSHMACVIPPPRRCTDVVLCTGTG
jgi:hypothetical protein